MILNLNILDNAGLWKNKLNFGYGVNFKFNGKVHNNLDRVWVVKRFNLPQELNLQFKGLNFVLDCTYDNLTRSVKHDLGQLSRLNFIKEICRQTQPILKQLSQGAFQYQHVLKRLIQSDLYHALHSLSIIEELRFKRYTKIINIYMIPCWQILMLKKKTSKIMIRLMYKVETREVL